MFYYNLLNLSRDFRTFAATEANLMQKFIYIYMYVSYTQKVQLKLK